MRFLALATDYDGTLAADGVVDDATLGALWRLRESGRRLILVTGRELDDLQRVFDRLDLFDRVVAENGALLFNPATGERRSLGERPPDAFVDALRARGVGPLSVGEVIVATWQPHETAVLASIRELGLELQVIFNKGAVMVLPSGVNKASGLQAALLDLGLSPHNVVAVGDAENDHAFLELCECSVAVSNALPALKDRADIVAEHPRGAGVTELIEQMLGDDLESHWLSIQRHAVLLGNRDDGAPVSLRPYGESALLAGTSGSGKSTLATAILERLGAQGYQFCIIDPEGDYEGFPGAVVLGDAQREPGLTELFDLLEQPGQSVVVNLLGIALEHRPAFFAGLLPRLQELRARTGRPHWIVVDEAHHLLPASWDPAALTLPQTVASLLLITVHPDLVAAPALQLVQTVLTIGETPDETIRAFGRRVGQTPPEPLPGDVAKGQALRWSREDGAPLRFTIAPPTMERRRHQRKYAEGEVGADRSFYFRGPEGRLNLRAQNLVMFIQIAEGVDDETWRHHLRRGDYSGWFREVIKDPDLAEQAAAVERQDGLSAAESRKRIRAAIEERYTLPA